MDVSDFTLDDNTKPVEVAGWRDAIFGDKDKVAALKKTIDDILPEVQAAVGKTFAQLDGTLDLPTVVYVDSAAGRQFHGFSGNRRTAVVREGAGNRIFVNVDAMSGKSRDEIAQIMLHEVFHLHTGGALSAIKFLGGSIKLKEDGFENFSVQNVIAEGGAEYFSRKVSDEVGAFGPKDEYHTYKDYEAAFERAVEIVGEDVAKDALFGKKGESINRLIAAVVQVFKNFDKDKAKTCDIEGNCSPFRK